jgi:rRNA maturation RNase YbeY
MKCSFDCRWMHRIQPFGSFFEYHLLLSLVLLCVMRRSSGFLPLQHSILPRSSSILTSKRNLFRRFHTFSNIATTNNVKVCCQFMQTKTSPIGGVNFGTRNRDTSFARLFGSKRGIPNSPLGTISIFNEQSTLSDIDVDAIRVTMHRISKILGYETYDVTLLLVDDDEMRETNFETRGIDAPTDILSFPFHFHKKPGLLVDPEFDIPDYFTLGDMMVCVPYVIRRCEEDQMDHDDHVGENGHNSEGDDGDESDDDHDGGFGHEDRGVSGAMSDVRDPQKRIRMLLVHGMLHLVGYDHEEEDEYLEMVEREEHILKQLGNF